MSGVPPDTDEAREIHEALDRLLAQDSFEWPYVEAARAALERLVAERNNLMKLALTHQTCLARELLIEAERDRLAAWAEQLEAALQEIADRPFTAALDAREMQALARAAVAGDPQKP